jgi:hypothetical protein
MRYFINTKQIVNLLVHNQYKFPLDTKSIRDVASCVTIHYLVTRKKNHVHCYLSDAFVDHYVAGTSEESATSIEIGKSERTYWMTIPPPVTKKTIKAFVRKQIKWINELMIVHTGSIVWLSCCSLITSPFDVRNFLGSYVVKKIYISMHHREFDLNKTMVKLSGFDTRSIVVPMCQIVASNQCGSIRFPWINQLNNDNSHCVTVSDGITRYEICLDENVKDETSNVLTVIEKERSMPLLYVENDQHNMIVDEMYSYVTSVKTINCL